MFFGIFDDFGFSDGFESAKALLFHFTDGCDSVDSDIYFFAIDMRNEVFKIGDDIGDIFIISRTNFRSNSGVYTAIEIQIKIINIFDAGFVAEHSRTIFTNKPSEETENSHMSFIKTINLFI